MLFQILEKTYISYSFSKDILNEIFKICLENGVDYVFNTINARYRYNEYKSNEYIKNTNLHTQKEMITIFAI